jgi:hemerythrin-like metal-binding protein
MSLITWSTSIALDIPSIDNQHQRWISLINDLHEAMRTGKGRAVVGQTLTAMIDYTRTHFTAEEGLMSKHKYPEYTQHKALHDEFTAKLLDWQRQQKVTDTVLTLEVMNTLKDWLINHIQTVDRKYVPYLKSKGVA